MKIGSFGLTLGGLGSMLRTMVKLTAIVIPFCGLQAAAQEEHAPPAANASIQRPPYGAPISLADAERIADRAQAEASRAGWRVAIAVVEPSGALVVFRRMDDTQYASVAMAIRKAKASAIYRRPTQEFNDSLSKGQLNVLAYDDISASVGGEMIIKDGRLIGAIGVSGATPSTTDDIIAKFGLGALK
jgi:uncharacterized protein GlcG (DUF336 family)